MRKSKEQLFLYPVEAITLDAIRTGQIERVKIGAAVNLHMLGRLTDSELQYAQEQVGNGD